MNTKPGWKTTEFWFTLIRNLLSVAVVLGVVTGVQADAALEILASLNVEVDQLIVIVNNIVGMLIALWAIFDGSKATRKYTRSRTQVKETSLKAYAAVEKGKRRVNP